MSCQARHDSQPINWVLPPGMSNRAFSGVIYIDWISRYIQFFYLKKRNEILFF
jgi:hypothetical protein